MAIPSKWMCMDSARKHVWIKFNRITRLTHTNSLRHFFLQLIAFHNFVLLANTYATPHNFMTAHNDIFLAENSQNPNRNSHLLKLMTDLANKWHTYRMNRECINWYRIQRNYLALANFLKCDRVRGKMKRKRMNSILEDEWNNGKATQRWHSAVDELNFHIVDHHRWWRWQRRQWRQYRWTGECCRGNCARSVNVNKLNFLSEQNTHFTKSCRSVCTFGNTFGSHLRIGAARVP